MSRCCKYLFLSCLVLAFKLSHSQTVKKWSLNDLKNNVATASTPTIFNFWATFCKPCIAEIPHFQELAKKYRSHGVKFFFVNVDAADDYPSKIKKFVQKKRLTAPVVYLTETDADLFCPAVDSNWSGAIPATLLINNKTGYKKFFEEEMSKTSLEEEIKAMLRNKKKAAL